MYYSASFIYMKIGIIGGGWVGTAALNVFPTALVHTPTAPNSEAFRADFVIIAVPTPLQADGTLDCSIVQECIDKCAKNSVIIIRSTVNPGFCDKQTKQV